MDIAFGLGLTPPAPSGDPAAAVAGRAGAVPADRGFGEQIRHLLGAWAMDTSEVVPAGIGIARSERTPASARTPIEDASASADAGDPVDKAPAHIAALVDPALWLHRPSVAPHSSLAGAPVGVAPVAEALADSPPSYVDTPPSHEVVARSGGQQPPVGEHRPAAASWRSGSPFLVTSADALASPVHDGHGERADAALDSVPDRPGVMAPVPHAATRPERLPEMVERPERVPRPVTPRPVTTSAWTVPLPPPSAVAGEPGPEPPAANTAAVPRSMTRPMESLARERDQAPAPVPAPALRSQGESTRDDASSDASAEVSRPAVPMPGVAELRDTEANARPEIAGTPRIAAGRRVANRGPEPGRTTVEARHVPHAGMEAAVHETPTSANVARAAAFEATPLPGTVKPRAIQTTVTVDHVVGPVDVAEPSTPRGVTTAWTDASSTDLTPSDETAIEHQIVQSLRLHTTGDGGEARVRLRPEYLGEVTIKVVVEDGVVSARLEASVPAVRDWVERHEASLRQALGEHGLTLDTLSVHDQPTADDSRDTLDRDRERDSDPRDRPRRPRRRTDPDSPRFEVEG